MLTPAAVLNTASLLLASTLTARRALYIWRAGLAFLGQLVAAHGLLL